MFDGKSGARDDHGANNSAANATPAHTRRPFAPARLGKIKSIESF
jgi:hypothetical protein